MSPAAGMVYLVGAGPGDPQLITVRGRRLLSRADVVIHDRLVNRALLRMTRAGAELVNVGKSPGRKCVTQEQIHRLLIEHARRGRRVVRLKGGDPFVFGRGFEELTACREAGVPCVVVPGVSSALAGPAAVGIPVTDRNSARSFGVFTAATATMEDEGAPRLDYEALARLDTVVVMMGGERLADVARRLIEAGRDPATPAACIQSATTSRERVTVATLETIAAAAVREGLRAPLVTIIGEVAGLGGHPGIATTDTRALAGVRVLVTRPRSTSRELTAFLRGHGAEVIPCPLLRVTYRSSAPALDTAVSNLATFDWVVFTSVHGVRAVARRLRATGRDARAFGGARVAAVGPATAAELAPLGICPDLVPETFTAAALSESLVRASAGRLGRVLLPRADIAGAELPNALRDAGADVHEVAAYRTHSMTPPRRVLAELSKGVDVIVFCSPSAVRRYVALRLGVAEAMIVCLGPVTAEAARRAGLRVQMVAENHSAVGLVTALKSAFSASEALP